MKILEIVYGIFMLAVFVTVISFLAITIREKHQCESKNGIYLRSMFEIGFTCYDTETLRIIE